MYNFGSFDAFIVKPKIMPDFARNLLHYKKDMVRIVMASRQLCLGRKKMGR